MNTNINKMTEMVPCNNLFSSHHQLLMRTILHFLTGKRDTFLTRCLEAQGRELIEQFRYVNQSLICFA